MKSVRTAREDADVGVGRELGRADDPLDPQRLLLELVVRHLVDVDVADDLEDLLVQFRAVLGDLARRR